MRCQRSGDRDPLALPAAKFVGKQARHFRLKPDEFERFRKLIGRDPSFTELGIVSAMWNEHCSYKSSKVHLRGLPTKSGRHPQQPLKQLDIGSQPIVTIRD